MKKKKSGLNKWTNFDTVITILSLVVVVITLYPMLYVVGCSFSDPKAVMAGEVVLWPVGFSTKAYELTLMDAKFVRSFFNSVGYVVIGCILMLFTTVTMSYPLTRPNLKFRSVINYYLLIPMYFGGGMIPSFIVITQLGLYNSPLALIIPGCFSIWNCILCRTFMAGLPQELIDSAMIDGSNQFQTLLKIVIPLSKPVLAVIMIYTIVGVWNSWFSASIYTTNQNIQPVQLYLRTVFSKAGKLTQEIMETLTYEDLIKYQELSLASKQIQYSMIVLSTLPIIMVYPMFQKHFTKGIMLGSLKG